MKSIVFSITALIVAATAFAQQPATPKIIKTFSIGGDASGWDYLSVNPANNLLYVSHGKQVEILDKTTGKVNAVIEGTTGVHGIAFAQDLNKGFISCGKLNEVKVFDIGTNKITATIATGENPDAIFYEPFSKKIIVGNGKSNNLSIIDPASNTVIKTVALGGKPEASVSDGKGMIYVNIEDKNEIVVVDVKDFSVLQHWTLDKEEEPSGLVIDTKTNRLFSSCNKMLVILDATSGKLIKKLPIGEGCDGVAFDPEAKNIYTSNGEGTISVIHENNANSFTKLKDVITQKGARTISIDLPTHLLYLPTADFNQNEKDDRGRAKIVPGSFRVLIIG